MKPRCQANPMSRDRKGNDNQPGSSRILGLRNIRILGLRNKGASPASTGHPRAAPGGTTLPCARPPRLSLRRRPSGPPNDHRLDTDRIPRRAHDRMSVITERDQPLRARSECRRGRPRQGRLSARMASLTKALRGRRLHKRPVARRGLVPRWPHCVRGCYRAALPIGLTGRLPWASGRSRCRSAGW
jgi:hypothetical protein